MFTVTHEHQDGRQEVFSAVQVQYIPFTEDAGDTAGVHFLCGPDQAVPGVRVGSVKDGTVFVMNDRGATVAKYNMVRPPAAPSDYHKYTGADKLKLQAGVSI